MKNKIKRTKNLDAFMGNGPVGDIGCFLVKGNAEIGSRIVDLAYTRFEEMTNGDEHDSEKERIMSNVGFIMSRAFGSMIPLLITSWLIDSVNSLVKDDFAPMLIATMNLNAIQMGVVKKYYIENNLCNRPSCIDSFLTEEERNEVEDNNDACDQMTYILLSRIIKNCENLMDPATTEKEKLECLHTFSMDTNSIFCESLDRSLMLFNDWDGEEDLPFEECVNMNEKIVYIIVKCYIAISEVYKTFDHTLLFIEAISEYVADYEQRMKSGQINAKDMLYLDKQISDLYAYFNISEV